jgi:hypothetical protein
MTPRTILLLTLATAASTAACGTAVFEHHVTVAIVDPAGRLGDGPIEVSLFDHRMGSSEEWARRTIGVSTSSAPYAGRVSATATKMVLDTSLPADVAAGLAIPAYETRGYFLLDLRPQAGTDDVSLAFVPYGAYVPEGDAVAPLRARITSEPGDRGWRISLTVHIPEP